MDKYSLAKHTFAIAQLLAMLAAFTPSWPIRLSAKKLS